MVQASFNILRVKYLIVDKPAGDRTWIGVVEKSERVWRSLERKARTAVRDI